MSVRIEKSARFFIAYLKISFSGSITILKWSGVCQTKPLPLHENLAYYKLCGREAKRDVYFYYKRRKFKTEAIEEIIRPITNK